MFHFILTPTSRSLTKVVEHLTAGAKKKVTTDADRAKSVFKEDPAIPPTFRARLKDYLNSGYDRGHMAPSADASHLSQQAMNETFYLSNIAPQVGAGFNREYWAYLERFVRKLPKQFEHVYVMTGPMYLPKLDEKTGKHYVTYEVIGNPPNVAVPTHFYKVVVGVGFKGSHSPASTPSSPTQALAPSQTAPDNHVYIASFVLPNEPIDDHMPLLSFLTPIDAIEHSTGIEFFKTMLKDPPPGKVKQLCLKIECEVAVKKFDQAVKQIKNS
jgi:endonuclease G